MKLRVYFFIAKCCFGEAGERPKDNPVPAFYRNFFKGHKVSERSSWDFIAVLYAFRGLSDYFMAVSEGKRVGQKDGSKQWIDGAPSNPSYLVYKIPQAEPAAVIEDLLLTRRVR